MSVVEMNPRHKLVWFAALTPFLVVAAYVAYLTVTYIDDSTNVGSAYGFAIGASKSEALKSVIELRKEYPGAVVRVGYGQRPVDFSTVVPSDSALPELAAYERWTVLLDGEGKFSNSTRITFANGRLNQIHRHRQYFEIPQTPCTPLERFL